MSLQKYISMARVIRFTQVYVRSFSVSSIFMNKKPLVAAKEPFMESIVDGKKYSWCSCGASQKQPFCDGSHKKMRMRPVRIVAEVTGEVYFCGCKQTQNPPYCDGSHMNENVQNCTLGECI